MGKKFKVFIVCWLLFLFVALYVSVDFILDGELTLKVEDYFTGKDKTETIEINDLHMAFIGNKNAVTSFVIEIEKSDMKVKELDFIIKGELVNLSSDIDYKDLKSTMLTYELVLKNELEKYGIDMKGLYVTGWLMR